MDVNSGGHSGLNDQCEKLRLLLMMYHVDGVRVSQMNDAFFAAFGSALPPAVNPDKETELGNIKARLKGFVSFVVRDGIQYVKAAPYTKSEMLEKVQAVMEYKSFKDFDIFGDVDHSLLDEVIGICERSADEESCLKRDPHSLKAEKKWNVGGKSPSSIKTEVIGSPDNRDGKEDVFDEVGLDLRKSFRSDEEACVGKTATTTGMRRMETESDTSDRNCLKSPAPLLSAPLLGSSATSHDSNPAVKMMLQRNEDPPSKKRKLDSRDSGTAIGVLPKTTNIVKATCSRGASLLDRRTPKYIWAIFDNLPKEQYVKKIGIGTSYTKGVLKNWKCFFSFGKRSVFIGLEGAAYEVTQYGRDRVLHRVENLTLPQDSVVYGEIIIGSRPQVLLVYDVQLFENGSPTTLSYEERMDFFQNMLSADESYKESNPDEDYSLAGSPKKTVVKCVKPNSFALAFDFLITCVKNNSTTMKTFGGHAIKVNDAPHELLFLDTSKPGFSDSMKTRWCWRFRKVKAVEAAREVLRLIYCDDNDMEIYEILGNYNDLQGGRKSKTASKLKPMA